MTEPKNTPTRRDSIFERSVSLDPFLPEWSQPNSPPKLNRVMLVASSGSMGLGQLAACLNSEDFVAPVLDSTAELFSDPNSHLDDVTVLLCECDGSKHGCKRNPLNRTRSRLAICNKLMKALDVSVDDEPVEAEPDEEPAADDPARATINFYSFAEALHDENVDSMHARKMSDLIS